MKSATPFKIHDENAGLRQLKGGKTPIGKKLVPSSQLKDLSTQKKGLSAVKSNRKALSNLSTSQVNARLTTPAKNAQKGEGVVQKTGQKVSFAIRDSASKDFSTTKGGGLKNREMTPAAVSSKLEASEHYYDFYDFTAEDMLCTRMVEEEDIYDAVMKVANEHKVVVKNFGGNIHAYDDKFSDFSTSMAFTAYEPSEKDVNWSQDEGSSSFGFLEAVEDSMYAGGGGHSASFAQVSAVGATAAADEAETSLMDLSDL
mmetsp:Transcript_8612/g.14312  ORF Transcript_8612/g.14312 Transcript_8612/m.14312 type:complete len:257 (-) Transcript_8612:196-966(-)